MFKQQVIGVISLSMPLVILFQLYPHFVFSLFGKLACSLLVGAYALYLSRKAAKNLQNSLKYEPTSPYKEELQKLITSCGIDAKAVIVNYAYTNEMIGMNVFNTIIMDPVVCSDLNGDPEALKVKDIFEKFIKPTLSPAQIDRLSKIEALLSSHVQRFIFKHELGHLVRNFSNKKLTVVLAIGVVAAYSGITAASSCMHFGGIFALFIGMVTGGITDLLLTYASNVFFKAREEKKADIFAARYSSHEEIASAADFFATHQDIIDTYKERGTILAYVPSIIVTGYRDGKSRASYLRKLAAEKVDYSKC